MTLMQWGEIGNEIHSPGPRGQGGVYAIINIHTGQAYIGATRRPFTWRWYEHVKAFQRPWSNVGSCTALCQAWEKWGDAAFEAIALESVTDDGQLAQCETAWMKALDACGYPLYNNSRHPGGYAWNAGRGEQAHRDRQKENP